MQKLSHLLGKVQLFKNGHRSFTRFTDSNGTVNSLEFTSDGAHLIDACNDYACHLWKVSTKRRVTTLTRVVNRAQNDWHGHGLARHGVKHGTARDKFGHGIVSEK